MKTNITYFLMSVLIVVTFLITGCKKDAEKESPVESTIPTVKRTGVIHTVAGSSVKPEDLKVYSLLGSGKVMPNGSFDVDANKAEKFQILLFLDTETNSPCYLGLYDPVSKTVSASDTSTALCLLLMTPNLFYTSQAERAEFLAMARNSEKFSTLLQGLRQKLIDDPTKVMDFNKSPELFQLSAELISETIENLAVKDKYAPTFGGAPYIEDAPGEQIVFVNPRHIHYGTGVYNTPDQNLREVMLVSRQEQIIGFHFDWPPVSVNEPQRTEYLLGNGTFNIHLNKGFDFSNLENAISWNHPIGRGTWNNSGTAILQFIDLLAGTNLDLGLASLPDHLHITSQDAWTFSRDITQGNFGAFFIDFIEWMGSNSEGIAYWMWQESGNNSTHLFISQLAGLVKNTAIALKLLNFVNGPGPFFYDLVFAPQSMNYLITQQNGIIISSSLNEGPVPVFSISPPSGILTTVFSFDASGSSDDITPTAQLLFRWDYESDGTFDTQWSTTPVSTHTYAETGAHQITLQVKDQDGLVTGLSHLVNVGGGAGSASHVKLFMDVYPWDSDGMTSMLAQLGFTEGTGENTFEIINSSDMGTEPLQPGVDLVIISNDQTQTFYNNYAANQVRFSLFVSNGGSMLWEACDGGWNDGYMSWAGITLPGNIQIDYKLDYYNYTTDQNLPLINGIPFAMDHKYASHERFVTIPEGTTVYCVDSDNYPTLIECNLGLGWIIITGQPLEHQYGYIYGESDMERLLPRIVAYFTGKALPPLNGLKNLKTMPSTMNSTKRE